jgi:hypothetical protein
MIIINRIINPAKTSRHYFHGMMINKMINKIVPSRALETPHSLLEGVGIGVPKNPGLAASSIDSIRTLSVLRRRSPNMMHDTQNPTIGPEMLHHQNINYEI